MKEKSNTNTNLYFEVLAAQDKDINGCLSGSEMMQQSKEALNEFIRYLKIAIKHSENKQVSCRWEPLADNKLRLEPKTPIYRLIPWVEVELLVMEPGWQRIISEDGGEAPGNDFSPDFDDWVHIGKGRDARKEKLQTEDLKREADCWCLRLPLDIGAARITWSGYTLDIEPVPSVPNKIDVIHSKGNVIEFENVSGAPHRVRLPQTSAQNIQEFEVNGRVLSFKQINIFDDNWFTKQNIQFEQAHGIYWFCSHRQPASPPLAKISEATGAYLSHFPVLKLLNNTPLHESYESHEVTAQALIIHLTKKIKHPKPIKAVLPELVFECKTENSKEKWIQLLEDLDESDAAPGISVLEYFFSDNITLLDAGEKDWAKVYRVLKANYEEKQLLLMQGRGRESSYPQGERLQLKIDTSQLKKQLSACFDLIVRPAWQLAPLLRLVLDRKKVRWRDFTPDTHARWKVLTNSNFDGCDKQREFVCKALATPDFAILDGPPGTGKTTTILELIIQLIRRNQRVLLCGSTHAAINNVLERVRERKLLEEIFPLRIGDEGRAIGVEEFQFDKQLESWVQKDAAQLLLDCSNLVCGTTIGILRLFRDKRIHLEQSTPVFDTLIIDESSKTTFQEFLVPAVYAKRWILVGDIRQLSPFTDRDEIIGNLKSLYLNTNKEQRDIYLSPHLQKACFYIYVLRPYDKRLILPVKRAELKFLHTELEKRLSHRTDDKLTNKSFCLIIDENTNSRTVRVINSSELATQAWHLFDYNIVVIDEDLLDKYRDLMPDDAIILETDWNSSAHAFRHCGNNWHQTLKQRKEVISNSFEIATIINKDLQERSWAGELAWRLEREYWLRFQRTGRYDKKTGIQQEIEGLLPKSEDIRGRVYTLRDMIFPSVLEALSGEGLIKRKQAQPSTLNQGFDAHELDCRYVTLSHQHRMHPDISALPRELFYTPKADEQRIQSLLDGSFTKEDTEWSHQRYPSRCCWLDVLGKVIKNINQDEVKAVQSELQAFLKFTEDNNRKDKKPWEVAVLTFYKKQEAALREMLRKLSKNSHAFSRFPIHDKVLIKLATVDFFQGQEADLVFLSMVNTYRDGFLDSPNRLNVAITRARYQMVVVGSHDYFAEHSPTFELQQLAKKSTLFRP